MGLMVHNHAATIMIMVLTALLLPYLASAGPGKQPRVLQVVTNVEYWTPTTGPADKIGKPKPTGYWLAEFTHSYTVFTKAGWKVDVASPKGGRGPADLQGFAFYAADPDTQALVAKDKTGKSYVPLTEKTISLKNIKNETLYDAIFFVGGTGAMWDFLNNTDIQRIVLNMWSAGKIVSAVCHGPMAFTQIKLPSGQWFVEGKVMTAFSNAEEELLGKSNVCALCPYTPGCNVTTCDGPYMPTEYPRQGTYLIESKLKEHGAIYVSTYQDWVTYYYRPHVVKDGLFVTGQNPGAGRETAQAVVSTYALWSKNKKAAITQFESIFCSPIQQTAKDPPVKCQVRNHKAKTIYPAEALTEL